MGTRREVYDTASPGFRGRCTAPLLVDAAARAIVSNESADIVRMVNESRVSRCCQAGRASPGGASAHWCLLRMDTVAKAIVSNEFTDSVCRVDESRVGCCYCCDGPPCPALHLTSLISHIYIWRHPAQIPSASHTPAHPLVAGACRRLMAPSCTFPPLATIILAGRHSPAPPIACSCWFEQSQCVLFWSGAKGYIVNCQDLLITAPADARHHGRRPVPAAPARRH